MVVRESEERFSKVVGTRRGAGRVDETDPAATSGDPLPLVEDGLVSWAAQEQALASYLADWETRHDDEADFDCEDDANVGDYATDFIEYEITGMERSGGREVIHVYADGRVERIT
jgi:hypothetical protein